MNYRVEYFKREEFLCPCCGAALAAERLVLWLDLLRRAWGGPLSVNSGWRCETRNALVGGSKNSRHKIGCAADIQISRRASGGTPSHPDFGALAARLFRLPGWEFRLYASFVHVAVPRGESLRPWQGGEISL
jgi:hypothetical protein